MVSVLERHFPLVVTMEVALNSLKSHSGNNGLFLVLWLSWVFSAYNTGYSFSRIILFKFKKVLWKQTNNTHFGCGHANSMALYMNNRYLGSSVLCYLYIKPWRLWRKFQSLKIFIFPKIPFIAMILKYRGEGERRSLLEVSGIFFWMSLYWEYTALLSTTQLFLILKC